MGMFDRVWAECPNCQKDLEIQSKAGECMLRDYTLETAPTEIIEAIMGKYAYCANCDRSWQVKPAVGVRLA